MKNGVFVGLALCALAQPVCADSATTPEAWQPVEDASLDALRGGVRVGGLDVSMDVVVRDFVDEREVQRRTLALGDTGADDLLLPLVNQRDGAQLRRDATVHVRIPGFRRAFDAGSASRVRARIHRSLR
jgi:hypothetical protein